MLTTLSSLFAIVVSLVVLAGTPMAPARAAEGETPAKRETSSVGAAAKPSGWHVETRPVWRLQLPAIGNGNAAGPGGFGPSKGTDAGAGYPGGGYRVLGEAADSGTILGYQYGVGEDDREAVGINLHVATDARDAYERLLLQPGLEYQTPLTSGVQLNARVFSTYSGEAAGGDRKEFSRNGSEGAGSGGFRDIGLGVGIDYSLSNRWVVHTQAGVSRQLDETPGGAKADDPKPIHQFFGGVVINYRF